ncbi:serine/threonine-protein kinase [Actinomadura rudentiformis]|uniref:non-specific serine/threonine protein kinase n=1 Tax=Actinomadura rudentiformis TaxID=359158 RepID=A0A6H9Y995_9ACTN|nr:serine/threonine-protein kinase [Actinomadura rudentiformis]KAB2340885.1 serine/threonine protein kinase [Actinomadura rudentiformis]
MIAFTCPERHQQPAADTVRRGASMGGHTRNGEGRLIRNRYLLRELLGQGGMGAVWLAQDQLLRRDVAVKEVIFSCGPTEEQRKIRFDRSLREARSSARLRHPAIIEVYDAFERDGRLWIVMRYFPGRSLAAILLDLGSLAPERVAHIGVVVLDALTAAHSLGVVHRDVKPANILIAETGEIVLTDFGVAFVDGETTLTLHGEVLGTCLYMAPEQLCGELAAPSADLWALGATLYEAVQGHPPCVGPDASLPASAPLTPIINGLMRKDPEQRLTAHLAGQMLAEIARRPEDPREGAV